MIMKALWAGLYKCISPRDFKITIGKINEQFAGYDQQDSQELLLFLMDGLHEDLNKVVPTLSIQKITASVAKSLLKGFSKNTNALNMLTLR